MNYYSLGHFAAFAGESDEISVPPAVLMMGVVAAGTYVGLKIGGAYGAVVGTLIGAFVGTLASGCIKKFKVTIKPDGELIIEYETTF